jgi:hypothetical protein
MADFNSIRFEPNRPLLRELSADRLNAILQEIKRSRPLPGRGISVRQEGYGIRIDAQAQQPSQPTTSVPQHPFKLSQTTGEDPELIYASVRYGTVNGTAPTGMSVGDDPPYVLELTEETGHIYLGLTVDEETLLINSLYIDQAATMPEAEDFEAFLEIGSYSVTNGSASFGQAVTSSLAYLRAGFVDIWGAA